MVDVLPSCVVRVLVIHRSAAPGRPAGLARILETLRYVRCRRVGLAQVLIVVHGRRRGPGYVPERGRTRVGRHARSGRRIAPAGVAVSAGAAAAPARAAKPHKPTASRIARLPLSFIQTAGLSSVLRSPHSRVPFTVTGKVKSRVDIGGRGRHGGHFTLLMRQDQKIRRVKS